MSSALPPAVSDGAQAYNREFFDGQAGASLCSARVVLSRVFPLLRPSRVLDVGCGVGPWMRAALELGARDVLGVDGDYVDRSMLLVEPERFIAADLAATPIKAALGEQAQSPFDLVMCLEVAEHLPFERAPSLVSELCGLGDVVLFSAAVPFQFGTEHVNEQWPEFWSILFRAQGFTCYDPLRAELWAQLDVDWWYAQNTLLFARDGSAAALRLPYASRADGRGLSVVHPESLLANLLGLPRRYRLEAAAEEMEDLRSLVAANRRGDSELPHLAAIARARSDVSDAREVFPATRMEICHPENEIAELTARLVEAERHLDAANAAFAAERAKRHEVEAALNQIQPEFDAVAAALHAERQHSLVAMAEINRLGELASRVQEQGAARKLAELRLADLQGGEAERRRTLEQDFERKHATLQAETAEFEAATTARSSDLARCKSDLDHRAAALDIIEADLNAFAAATHALRASRTWRFTRKVLRMAGRLPSTESGFQVSVPAHGPQDRAIITSPSEPAVEATPEVTEPAVAIPVRDQHAIKRYEEVLGHIEWWSLEAAMKRLKRLDVFDANEYLHRNPDVAAAGYDPYAHFIQSGALEGRGRFDPEDLARLFGSLNLFDNATRALPEPPLGAPDIGALIADVGPISLFVSTHGNVFMNDIAEDLAADLRSVGANVDLLDEEADVDARSEVSIYIAPHEFFTLGNGPKWVRDDVLSQGFVFGTEQLQTTWFNTALPFVLTARGMLDICVQTVEIFKRLDMASMHVLPGARKQPHSLTERDRHHPLYGVLPAAARTDIVPSTPFSLRPIDISFFGTSSPRRDAFFARNAAFFADYETFNYCRRPGRGPIQAESEDGTLSRMAGHVCGHSKIALNIHREEFGYFEWHRMVRLGMCAGSLVVSDPCLPHPDFIANEHYLQENLRHMPDLLEWLLTSPDGFREAERIRSNVNRLLTEMYDVNRTVPQLLRFLSQHRYRKGG